MTIEEAKKIAGFDNYTIICDKDYKNDNQYDIVKRIIQDLKLNGVSKSILVVLWYCLYEATDNTVTHNSIATQGNITVGINEDKIRILVYDEGEGIYNSLKHKYHDLNKEDVIRKSLEKSITSSDGCGNGLYGWKLMAKNITSAFKIITNDITYNVNDDTFSKENSHRGTILIIEIPKETELSWKEIIDDPIFADLEDDYESLIENSEND